MPVDNAAPAPGAPSPEFLPHHTGHSPTLPIEPTRGTPARYRRRAALAVGLAALALYAWCLAPSFTYTGDCGELIAASYRLGIAHPSGYPL